MASSVKPNGRALVVLGTFVLIVMSIAVPLRSFVQENRDISTLKQQLAAQKASIEQLKSDAKRLKDRAYIEALARGRLNYVFPGEVGLVVIDHGTSRTIDTLPGALVPNDSSPWYSKLWHSTELADQPHGQNDPLVVHNKASSK